MSKAKNIKLVGFTGVGLIALLGIGLVGTPLISQTQRWADEEKTVQEQNQKTEDQVNALKKIQSNTDAVSGLNDELNKKFPSTANVPLLLTDISNAAASSGISASNITAVNVKNPELYVAPVTATKTDTKTDTSKSDSSAKPAAAEPSKLATMKVEISVLGTPDALSNFLKALGQIDRAIKVESATVSAADSKDAGGLQSMTISGTTLLYAGLELPSDTTAKNSGSTKVTPTPTPSATTKK